MNNRNDVVIKSGVCIVMRGRYKEVFLWDPKKKHWISECNPEVIVQRAGHDSWKVTAPTLGSGQISTLGHGRRRAAFRLAATHATRKVTSFDGPTTKAKPISSHP